MSTIERLTVTLPADPIDDPAQSQKITALWIDIDRGLADVAAGRATAFDPQRIVERGRKRMANRTPAA